MRGVAPERMFPNGDDGTIEAPAYGVEALRIGRRHLTDQLAKIEAGLPQDRSSDRDLARTDASTAISSRAAAEQRVAAARAATPPLDL
jgi:hypothetical protein